MAMAMTICMRKTSLLLLAYSLINSGSSQVATAATISIDASGEIEDLEVESDSNVNTSTKKSPLDLANAQFDWLLSEGGTFVREKIEIRPLSENDENNFGMFAIDDIEKGDTLMKVPISVILTSKNTENNCDAALTLVHESTKKGNASAFQPYIDYLYAAEIPSIPSTWSSAGKALLNTIQGPNLIPQEITEYSFFEDCLDEEELEDEYIEKFFGLNEDQKAPFETAYAIALTRSWDENFFPLVDMFNHHSKFNIASRPLINDDGIPNFIVVFAKRDISMDEELTTTYRKRGRDRTHHVATLLQSFGFVEDYPQQWKLPTPTVRSNIAANEIPPYIRFDVEIVDEEFGEQGIYQIRWISPEQPLGHPVAADHLKKELTRIREINDSVVKTAETVASESERETILDYYRALVIAYETVIDSVEVAIEKSPGIVENIGDQFMACNDFEALHDRTYGWEYFDGTRSSFQDIEYYINPLTRDSCLFLEEYLHACVSNRPHYHEVFVHYPAFFLEKVERVLFIGGGDSMVLHEVLKYEDQLELVVGLELDQQVVRQTFSRMGTQPHFDNDKVEWWFGDAAKTLNVLPTDYYGTFDLVIVDILSDVAESLKVTSDVTIMEAAMMLMKPTGIIVKNEDEGYVPGSTNSTKFMDHTVDVMYYDVPVYCLQTFVMGSNAVDFSTATPIDHKISNFYLKDADEFQAQFDTWHTSGQEVKNGSVEKKDEDDDKKDKDEEKEVVEINTIGLTMIIDAEHVNVPMPMDSASSILEAINDSVKTVGFTVDTKLDEDFLGGYHLTFVLEEGIIHARCFPKVKYIAFDVQLWKSVHKAESLKKELISRLGSKDNSVFRVVSAGVYGVEENDNNSKIGPPSKKTTKTLDNASEDDSSSESDSASGIHTSFTKRKDPSINFKNATMEDYDSVSSLEQWNSQDPLGYQTIVRLRIPDDYDTEKAEDFVKALIDDSLEDSLQFFVDKSEDQIVNVSFEIGEGLVVVSTWSEGSVVGVWGGGDLFTISIFSLERSAKRTQGAFGNILTEWLAPISTDMFPRGTGRVINYRSEFSKKGERVYPFWAPQTEDDEDEDGEN